MIIINYNNNKNYFFYTFKPYGVRNDQRIGIGLWNLLNDRKQQSTQLGKFRHLMETCDLFLLFIQFINPCLIFLNLFSHFGFYLIAIRSVDTIIIPNLRLLHSFRIFQL